MPEKSAKQAAERVVSTLRGAGHEALWAGGCVRDLLLNREPKDYDVVTDARPERVVDLFKRTDVVGAKFGVVLVRIWGHQIEVATFRADGPYADGRHPESVVFGNALDDARRRDFTVNGMFYDTTQNRVIDHVGGRRDLDARLIRAIGDPQARFAEDHLRMLRAVRFAARLEFTIEQASIDAIRGHAHMLPTISGERIRGELRLIVTSPNRAAGWRLIRSTGLADHLMAGVVWSESEACAVADRLAALPDDPPFFLSLAAMLCGMASGDAETACKRAKCTNAESKGVGWLLGELPRVRAPKLLDLAGLKLLMADDRFDRLCDLLRADLLARSEPPSAHAAIVERSRSIPRDEVAPPPLVTGDDLLARHVPSGPDYATILETVYRAQLNNEIADRRAAVHLMDKLIGRG